MREQSVRRLTHSLSQKEAGAVCKLLLFWHMEVYAGEKGDKDYHFVDREDAFPGGCVYVPEADYDQARALLSREGYESLLCTEKENGAEGTETDFIDEIQRDFLRKRKLHMIEWAILVAVVVLYSFIRRFF